MKHKYLIGIVPALLGILMVALPGQASADTQSYAAQARQAGLTSAQAQTLQKEVEHYAQVLHGTQVQINQVDFAGGNVVVPLPGQARAATVDDAHPAATSTCKYHYFCIYHGENYTGAKVSLYHCAPQYELKLLWGGWGSWDNNQSGRVHPRFFDSQHKVVGWAPWPRSYLPHMNWTPVYSIDAC